MVIGPNKEENMKRKVDVCQEITSRRITEPDALARIASTHADLATRHIAVQHITDPAVLERIAVSNSEPSTRKVAILMIADTDVLAQIAITDKNRWVRETAFWQFQALTQETEQGGLEK